MIFRGDGGSVPQPGNAADRTVECYQDTAPEYRQQDHGTRCGITAGTETHHGNHLQTVSISLPNSGIVQKWVTEILGSHGNNYEDGKAQGQGPYA